MEIPPEWIVFWLICGFIGMMIGSNRKIGSGGGFIVSVLLGPFGILIAAVSGAPSALDQVQARPEAAGWFADPLGRFSARWYDGKRWTQHVGRVETDGSRSQFEDPL